MMQRSGPRKAASSAISRRDREGTSLHFGFQGKVDGDHMAGMVDLGEYGHAKFTAQRHSYQPLRGETE